MGENFAEQVAEIKFNETQLRNIIKDVTGNTNPSKGYLQATKKWFQSKGGINEQTIAIFIQESIHKTFDQQIKDKSLEKGKVDIIISNIVDKFIPQLTLGDNMEEALSEIETSIIGPLTPEKLTEAIADYIKKHMKYDALTAVSSIMPDIMKVVLSNNPQDLKKEIDINLGKIQHNSQIQFNSHYKRHFANNLTLLIKKNGSQDNKNNHFIKSFLKELNNPGNSQEDIKKFLTSEFLKMKPIEASAIGGMIFGMAEIQKTEVTDIGTLISEYKIGVCRHYSMIAKKIYTAIKERHLDNPSLQDSELLYVLNNNLHHAYNVLLTTDEKGDIKKRYLDITTLIVKDNLYPETNQFEKSLSQKRSGEIIADTSQTWNNTSVV